MKINKLMVVGVTLVVSAGAYAMSMFPVRVAVNGMATNYRAMVIDGTTYVALRDVATLTGRQVSYNSRTRTVNIANGASVGGSMQSGGTQQRAGLEGKVGQLLVSPTVALRVDKIERKDEDEDAVYVVGVIRNPSNKAHSYNVRDGALVDQEGSTTKYSLTARELNDDVYLTLQPGEQGRFAIRFRVRGEDYNRVVITVSDGRKPVVFRAAF